MYKDIHDKLTLIAGKILLREESEANRDLYLAVKDVKEMLTYDNDNGHLYCPLCESLVDVIEEEEEEEEDEDEGEWEVAITDKGKAAAAYLQSVDRAYSQLYEKEEET